jgi:hypothetical protein
VCPCIFTCYNYKRIPKLQRLDYDNKALAVNNSIIKILYLYLSLNNSTMIHDTLFINVVDNKSFPRKKNYVPL